MVEIVFDINGFTDPSPHPESKAGERLHQLHESIFGRVGPALVRNGWSCFPQERGEGRRPASVNGRSLKWKPYQERLPNAAEARSWSLQCPGENVAIITGPVSGDLFALDVDVNDPVLAGAVREIAVEHLGYTPFYRFGRLPRVIMLYRHLPGATMRKKSYHFGEYRDDGSWAASGDAIEFLANGSPFTAYGIHHKTGDYFKWGDAQPFVSHPTDAPVATPDQIESFLGAVQDVRRFYSAATVSSTGELGDINMDAAVPHDVTDYGVVPSVGIQGQWVWEGVQVVDGRHAYLLDYTRRIVCANETAFDAGTTDHTDRDALLAYAREHVANHVRDDSRRSRQALTTELTGIFKATIEKFNERNSQGQRLLAPIRTYRGSDGRHYEPAALTAQFGRHERLSWLGERSASSGLSPVRDDDERYKAAVRVDSVTAPTPEKVEARRLLEDRSAVHAAVGASIDEAGIAFVADLLSRSTRVHVDANPTGAGKTTRTIRRIADMLREERTSGKETSGPIVFLQPSHANIRESVTVATDAGLTFQAAEEASLDALVREAQSLGLRAVHLRSKDLAGCERSAEMKLLQEHGLRSSGLCRSSKLDEHGELLLDEHGYEQEDVCPWFTTCGYQRMIASLQSADVVFAAHHWYTATVPEALSEARGLVVDESIVHSLLQTGAIPVSTLLNKRPDVSLTSEENETFQKAHGRGEAYNRARMMRIADVRADRAAASRLMRDAHKDGENLVATFARTEGALTWAKSALRMCREASARGRQVYVGMTLDHVRDVCRESAPLHLDLERHLWTVLVDAIERFDAEEARRAEAGLPPQSRGSDDMPYDTRLQAVSDGEGDDLVASWRVAWRRVPNWTATPTLLLDATADLTVLRTLFNGREVVEHRVDADPNLHIVLVADRSYSPSSLFPTEEPKRPWVKEQAQKLRQRVYDLAYMTAGAHAHGRMLLTMPKRLRKPIMGWGEFDMPANVDPAHYWALRGQDFAKRHLAAMGVGRSEQPIRVVDGLVAALTWDSAPEHPYDRLGNGLDADGKTLYRPRVGRLVRVRSGHDVVLRVPCMPSEMGQRVEGLWREAELMQFIGRLRGVYRDVPGTVLLLCDCPPEGLLVDDILTLEDALGKGHDVWRSMRAAQGVMIPGVTDRCASTWTDQIQVARFVKRFRDWPAWRSVTVTDAYGNHREGLVAAWQDDVVGALRRLGASDATIKSLELAGHRVALVPSTVREPDKIMLEHAAEKEIAECDFEVWQVSHPRAHDESPRQHRERFLRGYRPEDYASRLAPEDESMPLDDAPVVLDDDDEISVSWRKRHKRSASFSVANSPHPQSRLVA